MAHAGDVVHCDGPDSPHAFDVVPLKPRGRALDARCPSCRGHGEWNTQIDLVSFRCVRAACPRCLGAGWIETGSDPLALPDIERAPGGTPRWTTRYVPRSDAAEGDVSEHPLLP